MTLLQLFNDALKKLPQIADELENKITMQSWSKEKTEQAISIVKQLKKIKIAYTSSLTNYSYEYNLIRLINIQEKTSSLTNCSYEYNQILLNQYTITLSPKECNLGSETFTPENISKADKYFKDLLAEITQLAAGTIRFYYGGHLYYDYTCIFTINWEF